MEWVEKTVKAERYDSSNRFYLLDYYWWLCLAGVLLSDTDRDKGGGR